MTPIFIGVELATVEDPDAVVDAADEFVALADAELEDPQAARTTAPVANSDNKSGRFPRFLVLTTLPTCMFMVPPLEHCSPFSLNGAEYYWLAVAAHTLSLLVNDNRADHIKSPSTLPI
jgi:hypothetical protein